MKKTKIDKIGLILKKKMNLNIQCNYRDRKILKGNLSLVFLNKFKKIKIINL